MSSTSYKRHDAASAVITNSIDENTSLEHDEINYFINTRYAGPSEATWRILSKSLHDKSYCIIRLPVHSPNFQSITIHTEPNETQIDDTSSHVSMLQNYFALNERDSDARNYYYADIPLYYVFKTKEINGAKINQWQKIKKYINCICKMYTDSPTQIELFHLRILLMRIKAATRLEHLRTINGNLKETFTETCVCYGFIESDNERLHAMQATLFMMPK